MAFFSWLASSAATGVVKGFGGIFTDLRKMRLDAEQAMAETDAAREKEWLRAQIDMIDKMSDMNQQASNHMQAMMQEWWMKLPMLVIMWNAAIWITVAVIRGLWGWWYGVGGEVTLDANVAKVLMTVVGGMFGVGGLMMAANRLSK